MAEEKKVAHINGMYAILIAFIGLIGGFLLKDPIEKTFFETNSEIGGLWISEDNGLRSCHIQREGNDFYINLEVATSILQNTGYKGWRMQGKGKTNGQRGEFSGTMRFWTAGLQGDSSPPLEVSGVLSLQGTESMGVRVIFENDENNFQVYAFKRDAMKQNLKPSEY